MADVKNTEAKSEYTILKLVNKGSQKNGKAKKVLKRGSKVLLTATEAKLYKKLNWI